MVRAGVEQEPTRATTGSPSSVQHASVRGPQAWRPSRRAGRCRLRSLPRERAMRQPWLVPVARRALVFRRRTHDATRRAGNRSIVRLGSAGRPAGRCGGRATPRPEGCALSPRHSRRARRVRGSPLLRPRPVLESLLARRVQLPEGPAVGDRHSHLPINGGRQDRLGWVGRTGYRSSRWRQLNVEWSASIPLVPRPDPPPRSEAACGAISPDTPRAASAHSQLLATLRRHAHESVQFGVVQALARPGDWFIVATRGASGRRSARGVRLTAGRSEVAWMHRAAPTRRVWRDADTHCSLYAGPDDPVRCARGKQRRGVHRSPWLSSPSRRVS